MSFDFFEKGLGGGNGLVPSFDMPLGGYADDSWGTAPVSNGLVDMPAPLVEPRSVAPVKEDASWIDEAARFIDPAIMAGPFQGLF